MGVDDYSQFRLTQLIGLLLVSLTTRLHDLPGLRHFIKTLFWGAAGGVGASLGAVDGLLS